MPKPQTNARTLAYLRRAWDEHFRTTEGGHSTQCAEDFFASLEFALTTLAAELQAKLWMGIAKTVRSFWSDPRGGWYAAIYLEDRRPIRCPLSEYVEIPRTRPKMTYVDP